MLKNMQGCIEINSAPLEAQIHLCENPLTKPELSLLRLTQSASFLVVNSEVVSKSTLLGLQTVLLESH